MKQTQQERILAALLAIQAADHDIPEQYIKHYPTGDAVSARYFKQVLLISECNGRISELRAKLREKDQDIETSADKDPYGFAYHRLKPAGDQSGPRITVLGDHGMEPVISDSVPDPSPHDLEDYFKPVRISPRAIDLASKIIPDEHRHIVREMGGMHSFLSDRAERVFKKISAGQREGRYGKLIYKFEFDAEGPVLKSVSL